MSSFVHSAKHFNSIEKALQLAFVNSNVYYTYRIKRKFNMKNMGVDATYEKITEFVDTLRSLNALCVSLQYKHHYEGVLDAEIQSQTNFLMLNKSENVGLNKIALYKALQSLDYQIEIEHLKDLRELTTQEQDAMGFLSMIIDDIAHDIVRDLEEYEKANSWSI